MFKYCKIPLLRPPLVLPKNVLISRAVLILNVEHSSSRGAFFKKKVLGPVVQSVVSLTISLRVISLTVLADSIYNILIFFAEKM